MADGPFGAMRNGASGAGVAQRWIDIISHNVANVSTYTRVGDEPFRARYPVIGEVGDSSTGSGVTLRSIVRMEGDAPVVYDPDHPLALKEDANSDGVLDTEWRETTADGRWVAVEYDTGYRVLVTPTDDPADYIAIAEDPATGPRLVEAGKYDFNVSSDVDTTKFGIVQAPLLDLGGQLTDLIIASRQFQANTRVITAARETYESARSRSDVADVQIPPIGGLGVTPGARASELGGAGFGDLLASRTKGSSESDPEIARFGDLVERGLAAVNRSEQSADSLAQRFAVGDPDVQVHDVTVAAAEASLNVQMLVAVRDRAVEAYQQIINLQV